MFLKAEIAPGDTELYFVVLYLSVDGWLSADEVIDSAGTKLQGLQGDNEAFDVRFGQVTKEIYYIPMTRRYLLNHLKTGINIYLKGSRSTVVATQPAAFVSGFLTDVDATKTKLAGEVIVKKLIPYSPEQHREHHRRHRR